MSVTPSDRLAGLLPVVITGGRPRLADRPTARLLPALRGVTADPVWLACDDDAPGYERDGFELATYSRAWAEDYAAAHWTAVEPYRRGRFLGAFPGREQAALLAESRGCWGVLQLDDNFRGLYLFMGYAWTSAIAARHGGLALFADILAAVTLATNAAMCGAELDSLNPAAQVGLFARAGFPYSLFAERVGPGREPWYGPYEDDILHAYQYGASPGPATAAIVVPLHYKKADRKHGGGMRSAYTQARAAGLQRMAPEIARISIHSQFSNGRGGPRVFHAMTGGAIRTPLVITDPVLYTAAAARMTALAAEFADGYRTAVAAKVARRAARAAS